MMIRRWQIFPVIILFIFVFLSVCVGPSEGDKEQPHITMKGMVYYDDSGKYWGIEDENKTGYKPEVLDKKYQKNGLKVELTARLLSSPKLTGRWGVPIQIIEISALPEPIATLPGQLRGMGTITSVPVEGGFYGIVGENSQKYYPLQPVPDLLKKDGTPVLYTVQLRNDVTTAMWGTPVDVIEIASMPEPSEYIYGTGKIVFLDYQKTKYGFLSDAIKPGGKQKVDVGTIPEVFRNEGMKIKYLVKVTTPSSADSQLINGNLVLIEPV